MVLATVACLLRPVLGYKLVVDRHTNFKFHTMHLQSTKYRLFQTLSKYTVRAADLTIVTNEFLKQAVERWGGRGFVLPDKLPSLPLAERSDLAGAKNIVFVCTYSDDEPVGEVIEAARLIDTSVIVHITGDDRKWKGRVSDNVPPNVIFTGFLSETDYQSLLFSCDAVMVLTLQDHTLLCGAYEAVSLGKPLILSNQSALRDYFYKGVAFTENDAKSIVGAIQTAIGSRSALEDEIRELAVELRDSWQLQFAELQRLIPSL